MVLQLASGLGRPPGAEQGSSQVFPAHQRRRMCLPGLRSGSCARTLPPEFDGLRLDCPGCNSIRPISASARFLPGGMLGQTASGGGGGVEAISLEVNLDHLVEGCRVIGIGLQVPAPRPRRFPWDCLYGQARFPEGKGRQPPSRRTRVAHRATSRKNHDLAGPTSVPAAAKPHDRHAATLSRSRAKLEAVCQSPRA